jgi:hypothetical protein
MTTGIISNNETHVFIPGTVNGVYPGVNQVYNPGMTQQFYSEKPQAYNEKY